MEIYIDVLFLENLIINYLIISLTARFTRVQTAALRILLAALAGALYAVAQFLVLGMSFLSSIPFKILLSISIMTIAFFPYSIRTFLKLISVFYLISFSFAGAIIAFTWFYGYKGLNAAQNATLSIAGLFKSNSEYNFFSAILAIGAAIIIFKVFAEVVHVRVAGEKLLVKLRIVIDGKKAETDALIDTGNSLREPVSDLPVVIVDYGVLEHLLPLEIRNQFGKKNAESFQEAGALVPEVLFEELARCESHWQARLRLIPFRSLGKENGMMLGIKPDYIMITNNQGIKSVRTAIIGICREIFPENACYKALLGPDTINA